MASWSRAGVIAAFAAPLLAVAGLVAARYPTVAPAETELFNGVTYLRERVDAPSRAVVHLVTIDLSSAGLRPAVTAPCDQVAKVFCAKSTAAFLDESGVQLAVNANYFYPFRERTIWDFRPRAGEQAFPLGVVISEGETLAPPRADYPGLCFRPHGASIESSGVCPAGTTHAVAGRAVIVSGEAPDERGFARKPYPLTLAGLDAAGETLFLLVVDGKQPFHSDGLTLKGGAGILFRRGAARVLQLDGGGSTTLVIAGARGTKTLNRPIHTRIPGRQRPVATHLGFYARSALAE